MITVNNLINQCFQRCSLVGDGQTATGTQAMAALNDLQCLIAELNGQNLIKSDVETVDINKNGKIRIMESLPEGWFELTEWPDSLDNYKIGNILKVNNEIKVVQGQATFKYLVPLNGFDKWPDLIISPLPDRVVSLSRKIGTRYLQLLPGDKPLLDSRTKHGLPNFYMCETQLEHTEVLDNSYDYEVFIIETDSVQNINYRITYLKSIPQYKINDRLYFSEKILTVLEDGLCAKLCLRYKLLEIKPYFDEEYANGVRLLKRVNNSNRPMTYEVNNGSYLDNFYNGLAPREW